MRNSFGFGILAACLLAPSIAAADTSGNGSGWYMGFDLGQATASNQVFFSADSFNYDSGGVLYTGQPTGISHEQTSTAYRFEAGYWFNPYVGLQANYADLGKNTTHSHNVTAPLGISCGLSCEDSFDDSPYQKTKGKGLSLMAAYPLPHGFRLLARYGRFWDQVDYDSGYTPTPGQGYGNTTMPSGFHIGTSGVAFTYGLGASWAFTDHWQLVLGWDEYKGLGGGLTQQFDVRLISVGAEYHF